MIAMCLVALALATIPETSEEKGLFFNLVRGWKTESKQLSWIINVVCFLSCLLTCFLDAMEHENINCSIFSYLE